MYSVKRINGDIHSIANNSEPLGVGFEEVTEEEYNELLSQLNRPPSPATLELWDNARRAGEIAVALKLVRELRTEVLNALTGILANDIEPADTVSIAGISEARRALKDITKAPTVLAATDGESIKNALFVEWRRIADKLSVDAPNAASAFKTAVWS